MAEINLFSHYNPTLAFQSWLELTLKRCDNNPIKLILYLLDIYQFLAMQENDKTIDEINLALLIYLREWFVAQISAPMSLDYSVQVL